MFKFIAALLVGASVFLTPVKSEAYGIADSFTYNNAPKHTAASRHTQRRYHKHVQVSVKSSHRSSYLPRTMGPRPRAWCGWYMRQIKGVKDSSYNLARHWINYGNRTVPGLGVVVVWPHHVGYIVGGSPGNWIVRSGNWNNRVADVPLNRMGRNVIAYRI